MKKLFKGLLVAAFAIMSIFALVSCGEQAIIPDPVDASTIKYDGKTFTWTAPNNASTYLVSVNEATTELTLTNTKHAYTAKSKEDTVSISIKSVSSDGNIAELPAVKTFSRLATITNIEFDEVGNMSWESVDGATGYIIKINNKEQVVSGTEFAAEDFEKGKLNQIAVRPTADDGFSDFSKTVSKTYLSAPTNVKYDGYVISWTGSTSATGGYDVYVNGGKLDWTKSLSIPYDSGNDSFTVKVQALGDSGAVVNTFSSDFSEEVSYSYLDTVRDLNVDKGNLVWSPIEGATAYEVKVDNNPAVKVDNPTYANIVPGQAHSYSVKPVVADATNFFSTYCEPKTIRILKAPELLWNNEWDLSDGQARRNIYWTSDTSVKAGYTAEVTFKADGQEGVVREYPISADDQGFEYDFKQVGTYTVTVTALADKETGTDYDSAPSREITVIRLAPIDKTKSQVNSTYDTYAKGATIDFERVYGADRYVLYKEGVAVPDSQVAYKGEQITIKTFDDDDQKYENHEITYTVQTHGPGYKLENGKKYVYLSSLLADNTGYTLTILGTPNDVEFAGYKAQWTDINGADGYKVLLNAYDEVDHAEYSLENMAIGPTDFSVCALGNGHEVIASRYSDPRKVERLDNPTDLRVSTDADEYKLSWTPVPNARSYQIYFNSNSEPVEAHNNDSIKNYITTSGVYINIISVANEYGADQDKTYYVTSPKMENPSHMIKLNTPTFGDIKVINNKLRWNAPTDVNLDTYTPSYRVYDSATDTAFDGLFNSEQFGLDHCQPGQQLRFQIRAIGDGQRFLNSDLSDEVSFFYLKSPKVERVGDNYEWNAVASAQNYTVKIEGVNVKSIPVDGSSKYSYEVDLSKFPNTNKDYKVEVIAEGDGGREVVSSLPTTYMQHVELASMPNFSIGYSEDKYDPNGEIVVTITTQSNYTKGYIVNYGINNKLSSDSPDGLVDRFRPGSTGTYTITVEATGGVFDENGVLYLASGKSASKKVVLLSAPSDITKTTSLISWSHAADSGTRGGFLVKVTLTDNTVVEFTQSDKITITQLEYIDQIYEKIRQSDPTYSSDNVKNTTIKEVVVSAFSNVATDTMLVVDSQATVKVW